MKYKSKAINKNILFASTAGGHLTENLLLFEKILKKGDYDIRLLTEKTSRNMPDGITKTYFYSSTSKPWLNLVISFIKTVFLIFIFNPDWIITTGAEVGAGAVLAGKLFRKKTMFIETVTRFKNPTRTAKIVYLLVTKFYVQHSEMLQCFGKKAEYIGGLL